MRQKRLTSLLLALALVLSALVGPALAADNTLQASADGAAALAAQYGAATSLRYAVWQDGKTVLTGGTGVYSKTENRALTGDTLYGIGSVSKVYTAAAVMKLVDGGKLDLERPVTTYLPDFQMADPRYRDITVRMLLNHSSGLYGGTTGNAFLFDDPEERGATDRLLENLASQRLKADPGAYSVYCNDGFTLAQLVVEAVSGQRLEDYIRAALLEPMGLQNTFAPSEEFDRARLAKTYAADQDTRALPAETLAILGTGGLYATAEDLAAFGGQLCTGTVLSQKSRAAMAAPEYARGLWPQGTEADLSYGLGWDAVEAYPFAYSDTQAMVKGGDTLYYHAGLLVVPEHRLSVAVLSSGGVSVYNQAAATRIALELLKSQGVALPEQGPDTPIPARADMPKTLAERAGYYATQGQMLQVAVAADGTLTVAYPALPDAEAQTFTYRADGTFRDEDNAAVKLVEEEQDTFFWQQVYGQLPGLGTLPSGGYVAIRLEENALTPAQEARWTARAKTLYLALDEKYTSQIYAMVLPGTSMPLSAQPAGYLITGHQVVDENLARPSLSVPGTVGRDWMDLNFFTTEGTEYLSAVGSLYVDARSIVPTYDGRGVCTIQPDGYARWYQVGSAAGKTMAVTLPEHGAFYVYDAAGAPVGGSLAFGDRQVVLPQGGWIVFAGDPGVRFEINIF